MTTYTVYSDQQSQAVSTTPVDGWEPLLIESDDECYLVNSVGGTWGELADGDEYIAEWACNAVCSGGDSYIIYWHFQAVKGQEPADDADWPWDELDYIDRIEYEV